MKQKSKIAHLAEIRLEGLKKIDPALDLGGGLTVPALESEIGVLNTKVETSNTLKVQLEGLMDDIRMQELRVADLRERMLEGVSLIYGKESNEYVLAGGTRKSVTRRRISNGLSGTGSQPQGMAE